MMKKEYTRPEVIITSYEAENDIMLLSGTIQREFKSRNYSEVFGSNGINF